MIKILLTLVMIGFASISHSQIIKLDEETGSFKNLSTLPSYENFSIEGEVKTNIVLVEVQVNKVRSKEVISYSWTRSISNKSNNFEVRITDGLYGSSNYDFDIRTYKAMTADEKEAHLSSLIRKIYVYLDQQIIIKKNELSIDNSKQVLNILDDIIAKSTELQRSRNGLTIEPLSDLVRQELRKIDKIKIKRFLRKKNDDLNIAMTQEAKASKVKYITSLILSEITPFFNSELVQVDRIYTINNIPTEKDKFTLPINAGAYAWSTSPDFNKIGAANSGLSAGVGVTFPIWRNYSLKGKKMPSVGLSLGVLVTPIHNEDGVRLSTPGINIPVYGAIGFSFLKVIRLNVGVIAVAEHKVSKVNSLYWIPTVGLTFELDAWLGLRK